jgi:hypothetical protein
MKLLDLHLERIEPIPAVLFAAPRFAVLQTRRVPRLWTLIGSIASHAAAIVLIAVISQQVAAWFAEDEIDWSRYKVEPLRLHLAEPLFFRASQPANPPQSPKPRPAQTRAAAPGIAGSRPGYVPPHLELPAPAAVASNGPVLLQPPDVPSRPVPLKALPPLRFWARQGASLPKPPPRQVVVVPGWTEEASAPPKLAAPPVLAVPNREQAVAEINISLPALQTMKPPALPVANTATMPIRVRTEREAQAASFDPSAGQAVNVIAMAQERRDLRDVQIPRGMQNIPDSTGANGEAGTVAAGNASPGNGKGVASNGRGASAPSERSSDTATQSSGSAGQGRAASTGNSIASANAAASDSGGREATAAPASAPAGSPATGNRPGVVRVEHPRTGSFDVVIMQAASRDDLPDIGGTLAGNPVYSVYLRVGDRKEWVLEYCVAGSDRSQVSPYQVSLDDAAPITPPYPVSTSIPNAMPGQAFNKHLVIHGFLSSNGTFRNMKMPNAATPLAEQILALLGEWQFRPALQRQKAIELEILLVIPART